VRTPVVLVSGGLGSGKTTLIRTLVAANEQVQFGVIVNEFGEMGIDGDLLRPQTPRVVEIRNGCICCITQDQLVPAVKNLLATYRVDVLLIEMSGAGDPGPVLRDLAILDGLIELRTHLVLADATIDPESATRDRTLRNALAIADVIAVTKSEIAASANTKHWDRFLPSFNSEARVVHAKPGSLTLDWLLERVPRTASADRQIVAPHQASDHRISSICQLMDTVGSKQLHQFVALHGGEVMRIKGILKIDGVWAELQAVRGDLRISPLAGVPPPRGRVVFISQCMFQHELRKLVRQSFAAEDAS
jgi:G3E family GTPase